MWPLAALKAKKFPVVFAEKRTPTAVGVTAATIAVLASYFQSDVGRFL
jgi:hypothetical protein